MESKKPWREVDDTEIAKNKAEKCVNCKYCKKIHADIKGSDYLYETRNKHASIENHLKKFDNLYCDYLEMTGELRGVSPLECQHHLD